MTTLHLATALLPRGWADDVAVEIDPAGFITAVTAGAPAAAACVRCAGAAVPGMPNLHSHAFQRAMAGMAEVAGPGDDSFWTWREVMYRFVGRLGPAEVEAIAAQLYIDMLKAGFTAVGEFHYLHHAPDGRPYAAVTELSDRVIAAAREAGIGITHLPVLYAHGGFGGQPPEDRQRRFVNDVESFLDIFASLRARHAGDPQIAVGIAPHSLRAVTPALLAEAAAGAAGAPIHIHVAEQEKEVADCLAWSGARPVEWLLAEAGVDGRWSLVHATHMNEAETAALASSGAVAGLCPTTEANLGDGLFPAPAYLAQGGQLGIGSDSHISVGVAEELRWLEYGQRLALRRRNILAGGPGRSTGRALYEAALAGGAQALARPLGAIAPGRRADILLLDTATPALAGKSGDTVLDAWLFAAGANPVRDVFVGGRQVIRNGRHAAETAVARRYRAALSRLTA